MNLHSEGQNYSYLYRDLLDCNWGLRLPQNAYEIQQLARKDGLPQDEMQPEEDGLPQNAYEMQPIAREDGLPQDEM